MTNREWLNSLSNKELAEWLCDCYQTEIETNLPGNPKFPIFLGISQLKSQYTCSFYGIKEWLEQER